MTTHVIALIGCDAKTVFTSELTAEELTVLQRIAVITEEHGGGCQPVLRIDHEDDEPGDEYP